MRVSGSWVGLLVGTVLGAAWGFLGNSYEPGDSAIGTGLMGAVVGVVAGTMIDAVRRIRSRRGSGRSTEEEGRDS
ncbi:hypothetical protein GCM10022214_30690 [Actinomadura miaoliensis]|uniref:Glycine zipper 2TM domain-containing protein n=1 Tax=Actinomadura miaoliensis TaxID=430685 RepID=A0ABP7VQS0_9ACTN